MKKLMALLIAGFFTLCGSSALADNDEIRVYIDNVRLSFDQAPVIQNERTLVPMRAIFEALGAEVEWNGENKSIIATRNSDFIGMFIDSTIASINGMNVALETSPIIINERTMVPLRFVSEALNCEVNWDGNTRSVYIVSENNIPIVTPMPTLTPTPTPTPIPTPKKLVVYDNYDEAPWCPDFGDVVGQIPNYSSSNNSDDYIGYGYSYWASDITDSQIKAYTKILESEGYTQDLTYTSDGAIAMYVKGYYSVGLYVSERGRGPEIDVLVWDLSNSKNNSNSSSTNNNAINRGDDRTNNDSNRKQYEREAAALKKEYNDAIQVVQDQKESYINSFRQTQMGGGYGSSMAITAMSQNTIKYDNMIADLEEELEYNLEILREKYGIDD